MFFWFGYVLFYSPGLCDKKKGGNKAFGKFCIFLFHPFIAHLTDTSCKSSLHIYGYIHGCILYPLNISSTLQFQKSPFQSYVEGFCFFLPSPYSPYFFSLQCMYVRFFANIFCLFTDFCRSGLFSLYFFSFFSWPLLLLLVGGSGRGHIMGWRLDWII